MDSERDATSALSQSDEDSDYPEYGKCKKLSQVSDHGIGALVAHSCFKLDNDKLRNYIKAGYKTDTANGGLLPAALTTDDVDKAYDIDTREPSPDELAKSLAEKEELQLLEKPCVRKAVAGARHLALMIMKYCDAPLYCAGNR